MSNVKHSGLSLKVPPVALVFICALLMYLTAKIVPQAFILIPFAQVIAILLVVAGAAVAASGVHAFKKAQTTVNPMTPEKSSSLVRSGIYRVTRNPMYLGFLLTVIAFGFYLQNLLAFIWCPAFILYMNAFQIKPEETMLADIFGDEFTNFKTQVRRWI